MAGLSVLLETQKSLNKSPQIISKVNLHSSSLHRSPPPPPPPPLVTTPFLEKCYLCRRRLPEGKDIYMYRGNRAFCSVECRCRQIVMDEESGRRDNCSVATAAAAALSPRHRDTVAGRAGR